MPLLTIKKIGELNAWNISERMGGGGGEHDYCLI